MDEELNNFVPEGDNDYDIILNNIIKDKGGTRETYEELINQIAYHESAGTMDPDLKQYGGGPGRGKYQFEGETGSNRILSSAVRTKRYFKSIGSKTPSFILNIIEKGTADATSLSSEEQDILILGDLRMKAGEDLAAYVRGEETIPNIWAKHWWAGSNNLRQERIDSFNRSISRYLEDKPVEMDQTILMDQSEPEVQQRQSHRFAELKERQIDNTAVKKDRFQENQEVIKPYEAPESNAKKYDDIFKSDFTSFLSNHVSNIDAGQKLTEYNNGGKHEQNPYGGVPIGMGNNSKMNTVEEGETSFDLDGSQFIFSDRINLGGNMKNSISTMGNQYVYGGNTNDCGGENGKPCAPEVTGDKDKDIVSNREYKKKLVLWNLENNPEKLEYESPENYQWRLQYLKEKRYNQSSPLKQSWSDLKEYQSKLPFLERIISEVVTSPIDIAYNLSERINISDTQKYKSNKEKSRDNIELFDNVTDAAAIVAPWSVGAKAPSIASQIGTRYGKEIIQETALDEAKNLSDKIHDNKNIKLDTQTPNKDIDYNYLREELDIITNKNKKIKK